MRKENSPCSLLTRINSQTTNHDRLWKQPMRFQARTTQRPVNFPNTTKKVSKPQTSAWKRSRQDARQCPEKEHATLINCWPACTRPPIMPPQISPSKTYAKIYTIPSRKHLSKPTWSVTPAVLSSWETSRQRQTSSKIDVFATTQRKQKQLQLWSATTNKQCAMRRVARRNTCRAKHMASTTEPINKKSLPPPHAGLEKLHITLRSFCACFNMTDQLLEETRLCLCQHWTYQLGIHCCPFKRTRTYFRNSCPFIKISNRRREIHDHEAWTSSDLKGNSSKIHETVTSERVT